jgi:hypothetical protein
MSMHRKLCLQVKHSLASFPPEKKIDENSVVVYHMHPFLSSKIFRKNVQIIH